MRSVRRSREEVAFFDDAEPVKHEMVTKVKGKKQIIGYTSGVFDLFHLGHLALLKHAKSLCDRLIVGVTVDALVGYKNTQVIIPFEERIEIIKDIKCVDLAVPQDDLDKFAMWKKLKFDVMFIGDDWYGTERFQKYEEDLAKVGVRIIYLPYTEGVSTSRIKKKIIDEYLQEREKNKKA